MPSTGATPPKLQPPTVAEIMEHAEGDDLDKSHPVNGLSYSDTSSRSSSDGPTNTTASTGCRARLAHVFTLQIFLLLGCFGGTLSYLFISLRNEIDSDVNRIVVGSMDQYEEALTPPLHTTMNMLTMLHLLLPYLNETVPTIGNISDVMRMLPTF
ncbi:transmembrane protein, putative, partial [Bodo saltans]